MTLAFIVKNVNGAYPCAEMEGNQLLVGRYASYKKNIVVKVLKVNKNQTCSIQILDTQPGADKFLNKILNNVSIKSDITQLERYGISVLNNE